MKLVFGLSIGFQNGMSWSQSTKTHKLVQVLWSGSFPDEGPGAGAHGASSPTQQYDFFAEQTLKISVYFMQQIKSYSIFTARQTHRRTLCIPICKGKIFFCPTHIITWLLDFRLHLAHVSVLDTATNLWVRSVRPTIHSLDHPQTSSYPARPNHHSARSCLFQCSFQKLIPVASEMLLLSRILSNFPLQNFLSTLISFGRSHFAIFLLIELSCDCCRLSETWKRFVFVYLAKYSIETNMGRANGLQSKIFQCLLEQPKVFRETVYLAGLRDKEGWVN